MKLKCIPYLILFIFTFLFFYEVKIYPNEIKETNYHIYYQNKKINIDSPLLKKDQTIFIPLRELTATLKASLTYLRKNDYYKLTLKEQNTTCIIIPHSNEFWINNLKNFFSKSSFYHLNRLYVPLDFFKYLDFKTKIKNKNIYISAPSSKKQPASSPISKPLKSKQQNIILSSYQDAPPIDHNLLIPFLENDRSIYLFINDHQYNLARKFFYQNNVLLADLGHILKKERFKIEYKKNKIYISKKNILAIFTKNSRKVTIIKENSTKTQYLPNPIIEKNHKTYFPLIFFFEIYNLYPSWNAKQRIISMLPSINKVEIIKENTLYKLKIFSDYPIQPSKPKLYDFSKKIVLKIPNSIIHQNLKSYTTQNKFLHALNFQQNKNNSEIAINIQDSFYSTVKTTKYGADVTFYPMINDIQELIEDNKLNVYIYGSAPFNKKIFYLNNPSRLVIDIKNSYNNLESYIPLNPIYSKVKSSLHTISPPSTRLVFYLKKHTRMQASFIDDKTLKLVFPLSGKRKILKKTPVAQRKILKNKIIILDPGHGGKDPGAIGLNNIYEKNLTLDIALKLKKILEQDGAKVILTRKNDQTLSLEKRVRLINKSRAHILISIHLNSFFKSYANGVETYYFKSKDKKLASVLQKEMAQDLSFKNIGLKKSMLYVLNHSKIPAALIEPGFISNPKEVAYLKQNYFRQKIAKSLHEGILKYFLTKR